MVAQRLSAEIQQKRGIYEFLLRADLQCASLQAFEFLHRLS